MEETGHWIPDAPLALRLGYWDGEPDTRNRAVANMLRELGSTHLGHPAGQVTGTTMYRASTRCGGLRRTATFVTGDQHRRPPFTWEAQCRFVESLLGDSPPAEDEVALDVIEGLLHDSKRMAPLVPASIEFADDQTLLCATQRFPGVPRERQLEEKMLARWAGRRLGICATGYKTEADAHTRPAPRSMNAVRPCCVIEPSPGGPFSNR